MKYRVNYTYFDQSKMRAAKWEQREKDFETMEEALLFVKKNDWNVSFRNANIQPVEDHHWYDKAGNSTRAKDEMLGTY